MEKLLWLTALVLVVPWSVLAAYLVGRRLAALQTDDQPEDEGEVGRKEFDTLAAKVRSLSLEWEDTQDRLLRKVRSMRAAARAGNGEPEPEDDAHHETTRADILAAYRRTHGRG